MNTRKTRILTAFLTILLLSAAMMVLAGFGLFEKGVPQKLMEKLDLTDEQARVINDHMLDVQKQKVELQAKIKLAQIDLKSLMDKDDVDVDAVMEKVEATGKYRTEMHKLTLSTMIMIKKTLTPEQRDKLDKMKQERQETRRTMERKRLQQQRESRRRLGRGFPGAPAGKAGAEWQKPYKGDRFGMHPLPPRFMEGGPEEWESQKEMQERKVLRERHHAVEDVE